MSRLVLITPYCAKCHEQMPRGIYPLIDELDDRVCDKCEMELEAKRVTAKIQYHYQNLRKSMINKIGICEICSASITPMSHADVFYVSTGLRQRLNLSSNYHINLVCGSCSKKHAKDLKLVEYEVVGQMVKLKKKDMK